MMPDVKKPSADGSSNNPPHVPVLLSEVVEQLVPQDRPAVLVDATLGAGGHAEAMLRALPEGSRLIGIDRDPEALALATQRLAPFGDAFLPIHGRHEDLTELLRDAGIFACDGILLDLGVSSMQLDQAERGFSFRHDAPLDMRMNPTQGESAADYLARVEERELRRAIAHWGEERMSGAIARAIVREREKRPITRTRQLAELIERVAGPAARRYKIHPATRTFQAIRVVCNSEIEGLEATIVDAASMLRRGGRVAVISYHSLEDRAAKRAIRSLAHRCVCPPKLPVCGCGRENLVRNITSRPIRPGESEIDQNPRARSARLRIAERL